MRLGVLIDVFDAGRGGAEAHTAALARRAVETGDTVVVACLEGETTGGVERILVPAPRSRPRRDRALAVAGERRLRDAGCDAVIAFRHAVSCDVYLPHGGLVEDAWRARDEALGPPGVFARLARRFSAKRAFFREAETILLGAPAGPKTIAVSRALAARIAAEYPAAKPRTVVVPNGVDSAWFSPADHRAAGDAKRAAMGLADRDGAYVGLLLAHDPWLKGLETVLRSMALPAVADLRPPFHLVVAGRGGGRDVLARARALGVDARVRVEPAVADPRPLYAAADVLCHPTWHDPCSLACLEALAMGLPVITTPRNGVSELMGQRAGIVVEEPGNAEALAVAIRVLADRDLRAATADDAAYLAKTNRLATRLDQVLAVCRGTGAKAPAPAR
jgi:glycosyltransferase involved in cell wall biosynthesis